MNSTWYPEIEEPIKSREKHYSLVLYILIIDIHGFQFCNWWNSLSKYSFHFTSIFSQSVFLLASLVSTFGGNSSSSSPELLFKNFQKVPGHSLMGNETTTLEVDDRPDCSFACVEDLACFSFNFGSSSPKGPHGKSICELSNSIMAWNLQNFKRRPGFDYYGMVSIPAANTIGATSFLTVSSRPEKSPGWFQWHTARR